MLLDCFFSKKHREIEHATVDEEIKEKQNFKSNSRKTLHRLNTVQPLAVNGETTSTKNMSTSATSIQHDNCSIYNNDGNTYNNNNNEEDKNRTSSSDHKDRSSIEQCIMGDNFRNMLNGTPIPTPILFFSNGSPKDVKGWAESLDNLLGDPIGVQTFFLHLKSEHSTENIRFWLACENYKKCSDDTTRYETAQQIFEEFLSRRATTQINVPCRLFREVKREIAKPTKTTFSNLQHEIYNLMRTDSYPRFLKSEKYIDLLKDSKT